jgi:hypothetical protein
MMSTQKAKNKFKMLQIKDGKFDNYIAEFQKLMCLRGHLLQELAVINMFAEGLPTALHKKVIEFGNNLITFQDWVDKAQKQHQKYLYLLS